MLTSLVLVCMQVVYELWYWYYAKKMCIYIASSGNCVCSTLCLFSCESSSLLTYAISTLSTISHLNIKLVQSFNVHDG
jgi:hypothetical protein